MATLTNTQAPLIPASNFEVRKFKNIRVQITKNSYILPEGWGVWDKAAQAWVARRREVDGHMILAPWGMERKKTAQQAMRDGFYDGYELWKPCVLDSLGRPTSLCCVL